MLRKKVYNVFRKMRRDKVAFERNENEYNWGE